jgi:hypothetical protein
MGMSGVGIFPEHEEIFVGNECADAAGIGICSRGGSRLQGVGASHSQMRQSSRPAVPNDAAVVKRRFDCHALTRGSEFQSLCRGLPRFCGIAVSGFPLSANRLKYCPSFLAVRSYCGVHSPLGQFPRLAQMTAIRLGVRCQRQPKVLVIGLARKPLLLFRLTSYFCVTKTIR